MKLWAVTFIFTLCLCACAHQVQPVDPTNIHDLQNMTAEPTTPLGPNEVSPLRLKALQDTALSLGAQGGLAFSSEQINARLQKDRWYLETIYNFNGMMLTHGVLPPVLVEGNNSLNLADPNTIRIADKTYQIAQQARFATTPPNWREYLWMKYSKPDLPHKTLLPREKEERKIWARAIRSGWEKGMQQAYSIFRQNLALLKRDYNGMILYRKLLQQHIVSAPYVSKTELGVTGDGTDMRVNDQVLRITELPKLQTDSSHWQAIVVKENER